MDDEGGISLPHLRHLRGMPLGHVTLKHSINRLNERNCLRESIRIVHAPASQSAVVQPMAACAVEESRHIRDAVQFGSGSSRGNNPMCGIRGDRTQGRPSRVAQAQRELVANKLEQHVAIRLVHHRVFRHWLAVIGRVVEELPFESLDDCVRQLGIETDGFH